MDSPLHLKGEDLAAMRCYMRIEWDRQQAKCGQGLQTQLSAQRNFEFQFGENDKVYQIVEEKLTFNLLPPEPD